MKVSGGRWSHKLTTSSGILGGAGVVGNPDTTCHDWAIGSIGGGAACERLVLIGLAGGGTGRVAHGSRPGSYGSATGVAGGGAFLVQVACRGLGDLGLGREGERRWEWALLGVVSRRRGCSLWLALRLVAVMIMSPYGLGAGIGRCQRKLW